MRRLLFTFVPLVALAAAGCGKKPTGGNCANDKECAEQQGYGKICVQGKCQECGKDADCPAGFACRDNKCAPRSECDESRPCADGRQCQGGRCVAPPPPPVTSGADSGAGAGPACELERVSFDFDAATLRADARDVLARNADCIKQMRPKRLVVEGHCDERGTNEYNQHLGQRRAESVRRYLVNLGVDGGTLDTVSFGEE
jgi:peptidoglycan-associated lipoprotein